VHTLNDVPLAPRTTLGVGGAARELFEANSEGDVAEAVAWAKRHGVDLYVLGGGSNVVVSDAGVPGLVLSVRLAGVRFDDNGVTTLVTAAAGERWDGLVGRTVEHGLAGFECLSGIPGLCGATPIQNVGAYGQEVSESIVEVRALDRRDGRVVSLTNAECRFGYRDSLFKREAPDQFVVLSVAFCLQRDGAPKVTYPELEKHLAARGLGRPALAEVRDAVLELRRGKSMLYDPNDENGRSCGSFFVNPIVSAATADEVARRAGDQALPRWPLPDGSVKLSAAWLIERAGLAKGTREGEVGLSTRHSLSIVAHEGARAADVVAFARRVRRTVEDRFGVRLVPEPVFWGFASLSDRLPDERVA
jgi:UDP-N-acetylmuramate dehydrogenase